MNYSHAKTVALLDFNMFVQNRYISKTSYTPTVSINHIAFIMIKMQGVIIHVHVSLASIYGTPENSAELDQTPQDAVSDQVLHCLLTDHDDLYLKHACTAIFVP